MLLTASLAVFVAASASADAQQAASKSNILVIMGDDIGITNISVYSHGMMGTRRRTSAGVAKDGALFTDYYAQRETISPRSQSHEGLAEVRVRPKM